MNPLLDHLQSEDKLFDEQFEGYWHGRSIPDEIKFFLRASTLRTLAVLKGEVEKMKWGDQHEGKDCMSLVCVRERAQDEMLDEVLALLTPNT